MSSDKMILWCMKQKTGIKLEEPNEQLCKSYLKEANDALVSMNANIKAGLKKWSIITAYYARYNAIYALLKKVGIKSEIHNCSIELMKYMFSDIFGKEFLDELEKSKKQRIDVQYYTDRTISDQDYDKNIKSAPNFVLKAEEAVSKLSTHNISEARKILEEMTEKSQ